MTPIARILVVGLSIFTVDWANHRELQCSAPDYDKAMWVGAQMAKWHSVPFHTADHGLDIEEVVWTPGPEQKSYREKVIMEAADRLNDELALTWKDDPRRDPISVIAKLRSYAAE